MHDSDIAATEGWCEALLNIREESEAVHRAIDHESDRCIGPTRGKRPPLLPTRATTGLLRKHKISSNRTAVWRFFEPHNITFNKKPTRSGAGARREYARANIMNRLAVPLRRLKAGATSR